ncbi:unnamed protein product (macronuclear) [Paramecium tetraurelia]|uniref:Uncharacterized protein n=1 Tax=Paramecium tetraurelia TaxID=5888 RepID=A0DYX1_PARTE|nr:uncharacterized protein GSPATT00003206001 [Paramecium tetraurelia]CAK88238.1 unnamed protein product [Paramecium tetraurelia]|eukprot:XP_001455635.1 hypothetical protein (macronuclear) [Paramecium tetraurelia strain d4-2]
MKMERSLYLNGKPLINPPLTIEEQLNERLDRTGYKIDDLNRLNEKPVLQIVLIQFMDQIDLDGLTSGYLNNNPVFQMLKQEIMNWNEKVTLHRAEQIKLSDPLVSDNLYRQLKNSLLEVVSTRNKIQQQAFLNKVSNWFFSQLPKSQTASLKQSLLEKKDSTLHFIPNTYSENFYASGIEDYTLKFRSVHPEFDPPEDRVKTYQRKNLLSDTSTRPGTTPGVLGISQFTRPQTSQTTYKMIDQIEKLQRPKTNQLHTIPKQQQSWMYDPNFPVFQTNDDQQQQSTRRQIQREESPLKADKPTDRDKLERMKINPQTIRRIKQKSSILTRSLTNKKGIAPTNKTYKTDIETQNAYSIGQQGRLGEFQGTFHNYDPTQIEDKMVAARLNQYYTEQRIKEVKEQREDIEMVQSMKNWATNKSRVDEMVLQSEYLTAMGSQYSNVGIKISDLYESKKMDLAEEKAYANYLKKSSLPKARMVQSAVPMAKVVQNTVIPTQVEEEAEDFQSKQADLEKQINSKRLRLLKMSRGSCLPGGLMNNPNEETIQSNRVMSSSCFKSAQPRRQFSSILKTHSIKQEMDSQIGEIKQLKNRLASANKFVPINILQKSIMIPQGHANPYKVPLPKPGILLANVPVDSKQRKGKKKKTQK